MGLHCCSCENRAWLKPSRCPRAIAVLAPQAASGRVPEGATKDLARSGIRPRTDRRGRRRPRRGGHAHPPTAPFHRDLAAQHHPLRDSPRPTAAVPGRPRGDTVDQAERRAFGSGSGGPRAAPLGGAYPRDLRLTSPGWGIRTTARDYPTGAGWRTEPSPVAGGPIPGRGQLETIPSAHMPNDPADR
jgi:hypothetical protein